MNYEMFKFLLLSSMKDFNEARDADNKNETFDQWFEEFLIFLGYNVQEE